MTRLARALSGVLLCAVWTAFAAPSTARASVQRYAVIIGNDQGRAAEQPLRYAASDAQKVYDVLRDLGGFEPKDMVLLRNESAATLRSTLIELNDRIRSSVAQPERQTLLFVYYSGHADAESLHLGGSDLRIEELGQLVRGSPASFRLLVLDACRSGALTRVKGGTIAEPFPLGAAQAQLASEGLAFMTASSWTEDAQESDALAGSLFTHAFVSGLVGAADRDGDGAVVLEEAYRYAYDATLRLTSRTRGGLQHPTFHYDYRGQGGLVLTTPRAHGGRRGLLHLPRDVGFVVLREHETGPVVAELGAGDRSRSLSLRAGRYLALGRGDDYLLERTVELHADQSLALERSDFERVEYDRLVRKGADSRPMSHALELGPRLRSVLPNATRPCAGVFLGYGLDLQHFSLLARVGGCLSGFESPNAVLHDADSNELDLELRLLHAWDLPLVTFHVGAGAGGALFMQRFETEASAPSRETLALVVHAAAGATVALGSAYYATLDAAIQSYLFELRASATQREALLGAFALRGTLGIGRRF
jgi:hypothetical protein